ncbi:MAG: aminopeptidase [Oscillospiraceae bacterium]|nr:aminopeptidase [Oscillospiraceae bacterium]
MHRLEKYTDLIIRKSLNIKSNDNLVIWCGESQKTFAQIAKSCAKQKTDGDVVICFTDKDNSFTQEELVQRNSLWKQNRYKLLWIYSDDCTDTPPLPWVVVNAATESWAKQVFPHIADEKAATEQLWKCIFDACRIDEDDPVENWEKHIACLQDKCAKLNGFDFDCLHFENSIGTDLWIKPVQGHRWINCTAQAADGETIITNIPTEEVFTSPDKNSANGIVYGTRPIIVDGETVTDFYLRFENGQVVDCGAKTNPHLLKKLLESCENADRLGEIAIVPQSSPISQLGLLWYDTSFDENAGCHLALGFAYPDTIRDFAGKTSQQLCEKGLNQCRIHEDFVIGSSDMKITGVTFDKKEVIVFENGEWCI